MKMNREKFLEILHNYHSNPLYTFKYTLAIDFDSTLSKSKYPLSGEPILPIVNFIKSIQDLDINIVLWTCREREPLNIAIEWCKEHGIRLDFINESPPERVSSFGYSRKISYDMLIDDRNYFFDINHFKD